MHITLLVDDYDKAIEYYTQNLNFQIIEDTVLSEGKRWVLIAPHGSNECSLLLAKASDEFQINRIGNQTGGRVFFFLQTTKFDQDYYDLKSKGVKFIREPIVEKYGTVAVFEDLYGNLWDLIQPSQI